MGASCSDPEVVAGHECKTCQCSLLSGSRARAWARSTVDDVRAISSGHSKDQERCAVTDLRLVLCQDLGKANRAGACE